MQWFTLLSGVWSASMLGILILAIRLSYRIEARSPGLQNRNGLPRNAMIFHTVFNINVARDAETQAMRRRMNLLLTAILAGFGVFILILRLSGVWTP